jgi:hypothetical protein
MLIYASARENWRPTAGVPRQPSRAPAAFRKRKPWHSGVLQSSLAGSAFGELALSALEKAPFLVVLRHFLDDFLGVFPGASPWGRNLARMRHRDWEVLMITPRASVRVDLEPARMTDRYAPAAL